MCAFDLCFSEQMTDSEAKVRGEKFCNSALNSGLLLQHCNNGRTIRLLPNYMITKEDIDRLHDALNNLFIKEEAATGLGDHHELY
jgi:4-aminobutyrate aminotransferase-like enzyme